MSSDAPGVLIVENEADVAELYADNLSDEYDVRIASHGQEALEQVDESVNVVLLDRLMPGMSGAEVLAELRDQEVDVRVAMVTAIDPDFDISDMAFDAYLTKPVSGEDLRTVVEELLALADYDDEMTELIRIAKKIAALELTKTDAELAASEDYAALQTRKAQLEEALQSQLEEQGDDFFKKVIQGPRHNNPR